MTVKVLGIDIAKRTFQLHGIDTSGQIVLKKRVSHDKGIPAASGRGISE